MKSYIVSRFFEDEIFVSISVIKAENIDHLMDKIIKKHELKDNLNIWCYYYKYIEMKEEEFEMDKYDDIITIGQLKNRINSLKNAVSFRQWNYLFDIGKNGI